MLQQAAEQVVMVVTCDPAFLDCGMLPAIPGSDPDDPKSYRRGKHSMEVLGSIAKLQVAQGKRGTPPNIWHFPHLLSRNWVASLVSKRVACQNCGAKEEAVRWSQQGG